MAEGLGVIPASGHGVAGGRILDLLLGEAPTGANIDGVSGVLSWATDGSHGAGVCPLVVSDGVLTDSETSAVTADNLPPMLAGNPLTQEVQFSDGMAVTVTAIGDANFPFPRRSGYDRWL